MNPKVLGVVAAVGIGVYLFAPGAIGAAGPLLIALACPVSMLFMIRGMAGGQRCDTDAGTQPATGTVDAGREVELTRLRAEVDQLRAEIADKQAAPDR
ncbi:MAG: DUF2933 domain-containing protein [Acidimicrobiia bacterium]